MTNEDISFGRRIYKEIFYLDNYQNIINGVGITDQKTKFYNRNRESFLKINNLGVMDIKLIDIVNFSKTNRTLSLDLILKNKKLNMTFMVNGYPFRCPQIIYNNDKNIYCKMYKYMHYFKMAECLCCSSITCRDNWRATFFMSDIILEYVENYKKYISRIEDKYNCNLYVCYCKLGFFLPIADFL